MKIGIVLLNLGGPTSRAAVEPFLYNLFTDKDLIKLGGGALQRTLARVISSRRAPIVGAKYARINACAAGCQGHAACPTRLSGKPSDCCSPINPLTELQRSALQHLLQMQVPDSAIQVYTAMRYWAPNTETTMQQMVNDGITHAVLLPLYPQFSWTTTGSSFRGWQEAKAVFKPNWKEYLVKDYHLNPLFLSAVNSRIDKALAAIPPDERERTHLLFSAHGTPLAEVRSGDPYTRQVNETVEAVMALRGRKEAYWTSFQSRVGPAKWTQPNTQDLVERLMAYGVHRLVIVPIVFVTDHIETLIELNLELREVAEKLGALHLSVTGGLNDHPLFLQALAQQALAPLAEALNFAPKPEPTLASLTA